MRGAAGLGEAAGLGYLYLEKKSGGLRCGGVDGVRSREDIWYWAHRGRSDCVGGSCQRKRRGKRESRDGDGDSE